jgi:hypothetical protein
MLYPPDDPPAKLSPAFQFGGLFSTIRNGRLGSIVPVGVVTLDQPIPTSGKNIFLMQTSILAAKIRALLTVQVLEVQPHHMRVFEISGEVVPGARRLSAHPVYGMPSLGREAFEMFRIPWIIVSHLTTSSKREGRVGRSESYRHHRNAPPSAHVSAPFTGSPIIS